MNGLTKIRDFVIYKDEHYNSFPNVIKQANGDLMIAFRQAPDRSRLFGHTIHIDPASKAVYVISRDQGKTWDKKVSTLYDDYCFGVQDPCINVLRDGTLFCTFFTWQVLPSSDVPVPHPSDDRLIADKWMARLGGVFSIRSEDGGRTWDDPIVITDPERGMYSKAARGNIIELEDGSILLPMYNKEPNSSVVAITKDKGRSWDPLATLAKMEDRWFHEPNLYRTSSGKLVALLRTSDQRDGVPLEKKHPLFTCESYDNGQTWVNLTGHPVFSPSPFHLLHLRSGNVLLTYGHRHPPYGIRARILNSECTNIDETTDTVLREDGPGLDIGYTSSVQLDNGDILITYYYRNDLNGVCHIEGTLCREQ